ncbi:hypothetical protein DICPUDRAFT_148537 [Dictyostelium purpureum]|uniref:Serine/threonine-protein phosphatase 2A 55 kDa regulatory subunit B n=1 Tax=Dictyostelium purpureum TaxID=5786 RepID=F0ZBD7_DICPU|nr:uncharacterized protein DICPUDRAFT_148537 [Dictyostelium purpureum]EGC38728.1 hypothetical protein DICPUDRAFT_148537 [Dictyostelium purpureum]|eukprot:XP_003284719.1 hypothetical protein DICPUDRAFT_148537 [Dictyostelium purpureum]
MGEITFSSISTLELHYNGEYLAVGYENGSIAVLKILQPSSYTLNNNNNSNNNNKSIYNRNSQKRSNGFNKTIGNKRKNIDEDNINDEFEYDESQFKMEIEDIDESINDNNNNNNNNSNNNNNIYNNEIIKINIDNNNSYKVLCYYQGHDTEVIQIRWCKNHSSALLFISTSVSSTKLWRLQLLQNYQLNPFIMKPNLLSSFKSSNSSNGVHNIVNNSNNGNSGGSYIGNNVNKININNNSDSYSQFRIKFDLKRSFEHEEIFNINSISLNSDGNTFLSSDELRVYLWDLNQNQECYNIIDLKPNNMQLLNEVIRVTKFHPVSCNLLMYGTSKGSLKLCDMRESALINTHSKVYERQALYDDDNAFSDYLNSIFDMSFSLDGRYIVSRNLQTLTIWDMNMDSKPLANYNLYNQNLLNQKLYDMHESSSFVDKFQCSFINQNQVITGSYDNKCLIWNPFSSESFIMESNLVKPEPSEYIALKSRIDDYFEQQQQQQQHRSLSRDQVMSFFNKIYYQSNFYNIQLSKLSNIFNNNNNNNNNTNNNDKNTESKLTINNYSNRINSISTSYSDNNTISLAISSSYNLFLYK